VQVVAALPAQLLRVLQAEQALSRELAEDLIGKPALLLPLLGVRGELAFDEAARGCAQLFVLVGERRGGRTYVRVWNLSAAASDTRALLASFRPVRIRIPGRSVTSPSGEQWRVGRRWLPRPLPRWRRMRVGTSVDDAAWSITDIGSLEDLPVVLLVGVGALVLLVVLIPLLLFGIELILLGVAVAAGILARGLLGRPWVVQATRQDVTASPLSWTVVGLTRSAQVIDEVVLALGRGVKPSPAEATEAITPPSDPGP